MTDYYASSDTNETITGTVGDDTVFFGGNYAAYSWTVSSDNRGNYLLVTNIATKVQTKIYGVEKLQFQDRAVGLRLGIIADSTFRGTDGDDIITGTSGDDSIDGGAGADSIYGGSGNDILLGGDGDDYLVGNSGDDTLDGGNGQDMAGYSNAKYAVTVDLALGTATGQDIGTDTLISIEEVKGSQFADLLRGSDGNNFFRGMGGNDTIDGRGGFDWVDYREAGNGVLVDLAAGTAMAIEGNAGTDGVDTLINIEGVRGSQFADHLLGDNNVNSFRGLAGDDTIDGRGGNDLADYSQDQRFGGTHGILANLGATPLAALTSLYGIELDLPSDLAAGTVRDGFGNTDTLLNIENIRGTDFDDLIVGSSGTNTLNGGAGNDTIVSGGGADLINAGSGDDLIIVNLNGETVDGGDGNDVVAMVDGTKLLSLASVAPYLTIDADGTVHIKRPDNAETILSHVERLRFAEGEYNLVDLSVGLSIKGSSGGDILYGIAGNDTIRGNGGPDRLDGGAGNDIIYAGSETSGAVNLIRNGSFEDYNVGANAMMQYKTPAGKPWIALGNGVEIWNNFQNKAASDGNKFIEIDNDTSLDGIQQTVQGTVKGRSYDLSFDLSARANYVNGRQEHVEVFWNNVSIGIFGASSKSWVSFHRTVTAVGNDVLTFKELSTENDSLGTHLDNVALFSLAPGATLIGGAGIDTLVGGDGADVFVFGAGDTGSALATADVIRAFQSGIDLVNVSALAPGKSWTFTVGDFAPAGSSKAQIAITSATNGTTPGLLASIDVNGDSKTDYAIFFENIKSLSARDFGLA